MGRSAEGELRERRDVGARAELVRTVLGLLAQGPITVQGADTYVQAEPNAVRRVVKTLARRGLARNLAPDCWAATGPALSATHLMIDPT